MPVHNEDIAAIFDEIADLLEIEAANPFRVRAYRNAARNIRGLGQELSTLVAEEQDLTRLPGIGKDLAAKIIEIVQTGKTQALQELHKEVPASLEQLLKIPGLGPKRVKALYQELKIENLQQLEQAARKGQLDTLPGFGTKTQKNILDAIRQHRTSEQRFLVNTAHAYAQSLLAWLEAAAAVKQVVVAGSYRRGKETVGDLDILVTTDQAQDVVEHFVAYDDIAQVSAQGKTRCTVVLHNGLQVDLRVVEQQSLGAALHYFTGSKAHNIQIRRLGQQAGLKINEYGVFRADKAIAGKTEVSVFKSVGLPFIPPELREGRNEIDAARRGKLPKLVELADLTGDLHMHTKASDGSMSLKQMVMAARQHGFRYIAITDHTKHLTIAHGQDEKRLARQLAAIDRINDEVEGITVFKGAEVEILENGAFDLSDTILAKLDLVIGAVHSQFHLPRKKQTERILRAMDHRYFSILAHPSGRLLQERDAYEVDMERLIDHAGQRGCFLELNAQPKRLDLTDIYCEIAKDKGVLICINSDAHSATDFDNLQFGIQQARRGWLTKQDILNTRTLAQLRKLLQSTMN